MAIYVTHPLIGESGFDYSQEAVVKRVGSLEAAETYFERPEFSDLVKTTEKESANGQKAAEAAMRYLNGSQFAEISKQKAPAVQASLSGGVATQVATEQQEGAISENIFGITFPWHISFYQDTNFNGSRFELGVLHQTHPLVLVNALLASVDWDRNLTRRHGPCHNSWNDCISSVECHSYPKAWALFEHIDFGGNVLLGFGNQRNLHSVKLGDTADNWGDKCSSIIMSSASPAALSAVIEFLRSMLPRL